jgi:hypothetical protein
MREFFKGWRRKVGCALLLFTVFTAAAWIRSFLIWDQFNVVMFGRRFTLSSELGEIQWEVLSDWRVRRRLPFWDAIASTKDDPQGALIDHENGDMFIRYSELKNMGPGFWQHWICLIASYWSFVVPLTLLSAWLTLCQPRKRPAAVVSTGTRPES